MKQAQVVSRTAGAGGRVALTFDDCNSARAWKQILDVLRDHGLRAGFFPSGIRVEEFPALARRTVAEHHTVGSHGMNHRKLVDLSPNEMQTELLGDRSAWHRVAPSARLMCFRPAYGAYDPTVLAAAWSAGYRATVLWDVDPEDWTRPGGPELSRRIRTKVRTGSIVVLHAIDETAEALPEIIRSLRDKSLQPVALSNLIWRDRLARAFPHSLRITGNR
jgi:peptidoglycan-N-acetylglucosamine deacetylase